MKRMLAALALALCLLPGWALAEIKVNNVVAVPNSNGEIMITTDSFITGDAKDVCLWVEEGVKELVFDNVSITSPEDEAALTITADNVTLNFRGSNALTGGAYDGINTGCDLTINLVDDGQDGAQLTAQGGYGILAGAVTVTGKGTLNAYGSAHQGCGYAGMAISGDLTIGENVTVTAQGGEGLGEGNLGGDGLYVDGDFVNHGTLTATGGYGGGYGGDGIYTYGSAENTGTLTATGGDGGEHGGVGVFAFDSVENTGTLTATGGDGGEYGDYGVFAFDSVENTGTLTATGGKGDAISGSGISAENVTISGKVLAAAGSDDQLGVECENMTLDGVYGGDSEDGETWWDTLVSTKRYFATFDKRQKVEGRGQRPAPDRRRQRAGAVVCPAGACWSGHAGDAQESARLSKS